MAELTGQEVVSDIAQRLRRRFSDTQIAEIYKDRPVQSMKTPCIFIHSVETIHTPDRGPYAWWDHIIDIRCHPDRMRTSIHTWARSLGPMIIDCVSRITVSDQQVRASSATWRVEDDVLHVIVKYRYRVVQTGDEVPDMQTLTYGEKIKES